MRTYAEKSKATRQAKSANPARTSRAFSEQSREVHHILHLQRTIGNQAVQRLLQSKTEDLEDVSLNSASPRFAHDFSRIPLDAKAPAEIQPKLMVNSPDDKYEREADLVADQVMRMPQPQLPGTCPKCANKKVGQDQIQTKRDRSAGPHEAEVPSGVHEVLRSQGQPMDEATRTFYEPRFGRDFSNVRVHTDSRASESAQAIDAKAYTFGNQIVFGTNRYQPHTSDGRRLLAHELTHVVQQGGAIVPETRFQANGDNGLEAKLRELGGTDAHTQQTSADTRATTVNRAIELRPPGRGEASAFGRANELIDRLNTTSNAVAYTLAADGRTLEYTLIAGATPDGFDRMMTGFIDEAQVIPLRLITSAGRVQGAGGAFVPLTGDSFVAGYVDLDDLLGSSDIGFKLLLGHFITERLQVRDYARRIGTAGLVPLFNNAHARGREAEAALLQDLLSDPSVQFLYDELKPDGTTFVRAFRSRDEGYRVFWVIRGHGVRAGISITDIRVFDGTRRLSIEDFIAERAAAPAPAGP